MPNIVPAIGPTTCRMALIGEAPGEEEDKHGVPFVGKAGELLDRLLASAGIRREACFITNVVKERPPDNDLNAWFLEHGEAYEAYVASLYEELNGLTTNLLVPMGATALGAILGRSDIMLRRGSIYEVEILGRKWKVLPTLHPAGALPGRDFFSRYLIQHDLIKARRESAFPEVRRVQRELRLTPSLVEALAYIDACSQLERCGFDIETTTQTQGKKATRYVKDIFCFSLAKSSTDALVVPLVDEDGRSLWSEEEELQIFEHLAALLENPAVVKVGQNLNFDATYLFNTFNIRLFPLDDTIIAAGLVQPDFDRDLGILTSIYADEPYYKDTGGKFFKGGDVKWDQFLRYSALDAAIVLEIFPQLWDDLVKTNNVKAYKASIDVFQSVLFLQERGINVDQEGLRAAAKEAERELKELQQKIDCVVKEHMKNAMDPDVGGFDFASDTEKEAWLRTKGLLVKSHKYGPTKSTPGFWDRPFNVKSEKPLKAYIKMRGFKVPASRKTKSGETTNKDAIEKLIIRGWEEGITIRDVIQLRDDISKYWKAKLEDGRAKTTVRIDGTGPGRWSMKKNVRGYGFNLQNQPPKMKRYLLADPGYMLIEADLSQVENRLVAYIARDEAMIGCFERGEDVHSLVAGMMFGKPPSEISRKEGSWKQYSERFVGKKTGHAGDYGIGPEGLARQLDILLPQAKGLLQAYFKGFPNIKGVYWKETEDQLSRDRTLTGFGPNQRKRKFLGLWNTALFRQAYAYRPQSTAPDIINTWGIIPMYNEDWGQRAELLNQVHDSIWVQYPFLGGDLDIAAVATFMCCLKESLERPMTIFHRTFTVPVDFKIGFSFGALKEIKFKTAQEAAVAVENVWKVLGPTNKGE